MGGIKLFYRKLMYPSDNLPYEKVGKNEPVCIADEVPFEIPESWEWVRLKNICNIVSAKRVHQSDWKNEGVPFYRAREIGKLSEYGSVDNNLFISEELYQELSKSGIPRPGDLMVTAVGTLGKTYIVQEHDRFYYKDASVICFENFSKILPEYLQLIMMTPYMGSTIKEHSTGTTVGTITIMRANQYLIPMPPIKEQKRIIDKMLELSPIIQLYTDKEKALSTFNNYFPVQLKKSILQEAVQGKLIPQDPSDEPASVLLERIRAEKERLIQEGKIKRDKHESIIFRRDNSHYEKLDGVERCIDDEIPFEVPQNWAWARFGTAMINRDAERIPLSVNEREKLQKTYDYYGASGVIDKVDRYLFSKPLLLIGEDGANLLTRSKPIAFIARGQYWVNNHAHVLDSSVGLLLEYVAAYINAINLAPYVTGTAQPKMNQEKMNSILIPIPPTGEQLRIVQKIDEIFPVIANM